VKAILAFSAVGSLREEIAPGDFILPSQVIDRTKGVRPVSFFEGTSIVAHAAFGDPFSTKLVSWLESRVRQVLEEEGSRVKLHTDKTIICMEGPQFSTRAESVMYRGWGADLINMSVLPESKLAREAELGYGRPYQALCVTLTDSSLLSRYALIATATDYDSWRPNTEAVTAAEVFKTLQSNADTSRRVAARILEDLHDAASKGDILTEEVGSMKFSIMPRSEGQRVEDVRKLGYVLPEYFPSV
jgi:5'-methylthioadenosine phosphorylase